MLKLKWLLILTVLSMIGCQSTTVPVDTACSWVKPISTTAADRKALSRGTKEEIAAHNDLWESHCMK